MGPSSVTMNKTTPQAKCHVILTAIKQFFSGWKIYPVSRPIWIELLEPGVITCHEIHAFFKKILPCIIFIFRALIHFDGARKRPDPKIRTFVASWLINLDRARFFVARFSYRLGISPVTFCSFWFWYMVAKLAETAKQSARYSLTPFQTGFYRRNAFMNLCSNTDTK